MAAALAQGTTVLENCAREPEVVDLANLLNAMGARISGAGEETIEIEGVDGLGGAEPRDHPRPHRGRDLPDRRRAHRRRRDAGRGQPRRPGAAPGQTGGVGARWTSSATASACAATAACVPATSRPRPIPGFPTDLQAQYMALMTQADGVSTHPRDDLRKPLPARAELMRMGADIRVDGGAAAVPARRRSPAPRVMATDLRASACLVLAGLAADGETIVDRIYHLDRGYEGMELKLQSLGARVARRRRMERPMTDCLFQIAAGAMRRVVHEDGDRGLPRSASAGPTHVLVIPRRHIATRSGGATKRCSGIQTAGAGAQGLADSAVTLRRGRFHVHVHLLGGRRVPWLRMSLTLAPSPAPSPPLAGTGAAAPGGRPAARAASADRRRRGRRPRARPKLLAEARTEAAQPSSAYLRGHLLDGLGRPARARRLRRRHGAGSRRPTAATAWPCSRRAWAIPRSPPVSRPGSWTAGAGAAAGRGPAPRAARSRPAATAGSSAASSSRSCRRAAPAACCSRRPTARCAREPASAPARLLGLLEENRGDDTARAAAERLAAARRLRAGRARRRSSSASSSTAPRLRARPAAPPGAGPGAEGLSEREGSEGRYAQGRSHFWQERYARPRSSSAASPSRRRPRTARAPSTSRAARYELLGEWDLAAESFRRAYLAQPEGEWSAAALFSSCGCAGAAAPRPR